MTLAAMERHTLARLLDVHDEQLEVLTELTEARDSVPHTPLLDAIIDQHKANIAEVEESAVDLAFRCVPILVVCHLPVWLKERMFESGRSYPIRQPR